MNQESRLLEKRTFQENKTNLLRMLRLLYSLEKGYFFWLAAAVLLSTLVTYGAMLLSAFLVNGLTMGVSLDSLLQTAVAMTVLLGAAKAAGNLIDEHLEVMYVLLSERYEALQQEKLMELDFSLIDSPRLKEIMERIRMDNNWGAGIYSVFWQGRAFLQGLANLIGATVAAVLPFLSGNGLGEEGGGSLWMAAGFVLAALTGSMLCAIRGIHVFQGMTLYSMYHIPTAEEKKRLYMYAWEFAVRGDYLYQNGKDVRIYQAQELLKHYTYDRLQEKENKEISSWLPAKGAAGRYALSNGLQGVMQAGAYLLAVFAALSGGMPVGSVVLLAGCLSGLFSELSATVFRYEELCLTAKKQAGVSEFLSLSDEMYKGSLPLEKRRDNHYEIEFRNVSFRYPGSEEYALRQVSIKLSVGERLAIVGRNGSGKTTLIKLLCRLYDPDEGEILLGGVNIQKFRREEYVRLFSVIFQDYRLTSLGLAENIAVSKEYEEKKILACLEAAGFGERLQTLGEAGMGVYLYKDYTDDGIELSGGEAQKLAIARAVYKDAPFLLLDEPTAALDPFAEADLYESFDTITCQAGSPKTTIYISHRLSSCKFCDRIAVFQAGRLVQYGGHEELVADKEGEYARLWEKQAQYYRK